MRPKTKIMAKSKSNAVSETARPGKNVYFPASKSEFPSSFIKFPSSMAYFPYVFLYFFYLFFLVKIPKCPCKELPDLPVFCSRPAGITLYGADGNLCAVRETCTYSMKGLWQKINKCDSTHRKGPVGSEVQN